MRPRSLWLGPLLAAGALAALLVVLNRRPLGAAPEPGARYACSTQADYVGWNYWRPVREIQHNLVVGFRVEFPAAFSGDTRTLAYALSFKGRRVSLGPPFYVVIGVKPAAPDTAVGELLFPVYTHWLYRFGLLDSRQWTLEWRCPPGRPPGA